MPDCINLIKSWRGLCLLLILWLGMSVLSIIPQECHESMSHRREFYDLFDQFRSYAKPSNKFIIFDRQTEILYGGNVKVDYYGARHATTLNKELADDTVDQFRQRSEAIFAIKHKMDQYRERPVVEGRVTIGNTMFWRTTYPARSPMSGVLSQYDLVFPPVRANIQEAWLQINVDQLFSNNEPIGLCIKCGLFPFLVGRGISLGDWYNGGSSVYGFTNSGVESDAPKFPPGILVSGTVVQDCLSYDLYFSPAVTEELSPDNVNIDNFNYVIETPLDNLSDRHIVAGRLRLVSDFYKNGRTYLEPYFVFYNSPRNTATGKVAFDSPLKFLTVGVMLDHKAGGFEFNIEAARQFGRQKILEHLYLGRPNQDKFIEKDSATGELNFIQTTNLEPNLLAPTTDTSQVFDKSTGQYYYPLPNSYDQWQTYPEQNYYQYHPAYEFDLAGRMVVCDVRYSFKESPLQIALAAGYFSGDNYPYNDYVDDTFVGNTTGAVLPPAIGKQKNFLPLRDYHYTGLWAYPMVMFNSGLVPRPYNLNYTTLVAQNEITAATNIKYLCLGFTVSPMNDVRKFSINPNVCIYWIDNNSMPVWDKTATTPALILMEQDFAYSQAYQVSETNTDKLFQRINGWEGSKVASTHLGWELNCLISYKITSNMELKIKAGIFFPGQLYADLANQPNVQTLRYLAQVNTDGTRTGYFQNNGLGKDIAYGINARIGYTF